MYVLLLDIGTYLSNDKNIAQEAIFFSVCTFLKKKNVASSKSYRGSKAISEGVGGHFES